MQLSENALELAQGPHLAILATKQPSGAMQVHPVWASTDGTNLFVNTEVHRQKFKNMEADPTVTLTILDSGNHWRWAEIRGRVVNTQTGPEARAHIDQMSGTYLGVDSYPNPIQTERVMIEIAPEYIFDFNPAANAKTRSEDE